MVLKTPTGDVRLDANRQAIGTTFVTEVVKDSQGNLFNKVNRKVDNVEQTLGMSQGRVQDRFARRARLPVNWTPPVAAAPLPPRGATPAARQSRFRGVRSMRVVRGVGDATAARRGRPHPRGGRCRGASALASNDALRLDGVTRAFGALRAVDEVSLSVAAGQKYAILGSNGAGKTTLFNAITGDFPPTAGRIYFFGEDITELPPHERIRKGLRRTYQSSLLFRDLTVRDNLFLAVRGVSNGRFAFRRAGAGHASSVATQDLLERARLTHLADELVANLAHGQQRQLEIGMALAGAPRLILFDEPAAGLSPAERRELVALLRSLPEHMSFVLIEHDLDIALSVTERVTVMHNGRVLKTGTPGEIENDAQVQAIYMGSKH